MADTMLNDYPMHMGPKEGYTVDHAGPSSYLVTGDILGNGNQLTGKAILGLGSIDNVEGSGNFSLSGTYQVFLQPINSKQWRIYWNYTGAVASVIQNVAGSGMTPGTYPIAFSGGGGTGAAGTVTVLTATTIATPVITSAGRGYTTAPTATITTGGTAATLTASVNAPGPVAAATNLSAEVVRLTIIGR